MVINKIDIILYIFSIVATILYYTRLFYTIYFYTTTCPPYYTMTFSMNYKIITNVYKLQSF